MGPADISLESPQAFLLSGEALVNDENTDWSITGNGITGPENAACQ